ncbi:MAG: hypothetical protein QJR10_04555 [Bacillota bacterium]|nr:hypothetical protein [Bacillota bacterium]
MNLFDGSIHYNSSEIKDENALADARFVGSVFAGSGLTLADYAALEARWIDRELADRAGLRRVDSLTGSEIVGRKSGNYAGIIIPYFRPGANGIREYRLRRDHPDIEYDSSGNLKPRQKYLSPPGRSNMLYLVPGAPEEMFPDVSLPVVITEGEFKTLALWRLANHRASRSASLPPDRRIRRLQLARHDRQDHRA